ncbi:MAG: hypothetical protein HZA24_11475 [Nitrospirae bacterium]|nr:hypothetical protein [Nitrospirota bacterium]
MRTQHHPLTNQRGYALVLALLILALLSSLGIGAMYQSNIEMSVVGNERAGNSLLMAADAGVELGKNTVWAQSGFGNNLNVSFANLDAYFAAQNLPFSLPAANLGNNTMYQVTIPASYTPPGAAAPVSGYDQVTDTSKRLITFQSRAWIDDNGNAGFDGGERSRMVTARVAFEYGSMTFPYGILTQNTECILCHASIVGDVVSLNQITVRKMDEAYSAILGDVFTMGVTNLDQAGSRVVRAYADQNGDYATVEAAGETPLNITTGYSDPDRFPVDANGNPSFPKIENLAYYQGLAGAYNGGSGSTLSGGSITGVPLGGTFAAGAVAVGNVARTYAGNLILTGTPGNCVQLNGPLVVEGDLVIRGCVQGEGSLYAGGNVFVPDSVTYADSAADRLALAAGGNIVMGDYRDTSNSANKAEQKVGGGSFIKKELWQFNKDVQTLYPAGQRRYYAADDGLVYSSGSNTITPAAGDTVVTYTPSANAGGNPWITTTEYLNNYVNQTTGVTRLDALAYTANGIFGIQRLGTKQMTINGALVSADIGILIPGPDGKSANYDPSNIGLTLNYDSRMSTFLSVARNPAKRVVSWREGA